MDYFEPAQLDNVCPYPVESEELLKWTSLDKLEQDLVSFRNESYLHDMSNIFVIPEEARKTSKDIIDIRLCTYIKALEFILTERRDMFGQERFVTFLELLSRPPSIISSFENAEDTPDVRWFFKNRIMTFLLRESSVRYFDQCPYTNSIVHFQPHERFNVLENHSLHIDEDDCYVVIKDIILPKLEPARMQYYLKCADCNDINLNSDNLTKMSCSYLNVMLNLANRHESLLDKSIRFSMEKLLQVDQRYQARRLLYILIRVAYDRKNWDLINATLARLLSDPTAGIRAFAIRLFANLVEWNKSRDGTSFEMSEHFEIMIKLLESSSDDIRDANNYTWRRIGGLGRLKSEENQLLRVVVDSYLRRIDRITQSRLSDLDLRGTWKEHETLCWLIMPKINNCIPKFDFTSASNKLFEDLNMIAPNNEEFPYSFYSKFMAICRNYGNSLINEESRNQFESIRVRVSWLIVEQINSTSSRNLHDKLRLVNFMTSEICCCLGKLSHDCLSLVSYLNHCEIMLEIYQYCYNIEQFLEPQRCLWFLRVIIGVGPWRYNKRKLRAIESCLLRAIKIHPSRRPKFFNQASKVLDSSETKSLLRWARRQSHLEDQFGKIISTQSHLSRNKIQGIQSRRMLLVSLCKYSAVAFDHAAISRMIDLLGELELAHKLKAEQRYSELNVDLSLLPSCVELAFPTPFDDPNNPMYICEFAYFRDTMDYLRRNEPRELDRVCSLLSRDKIERLEYYQNNYSKFNICCSRRSFRREQDRFRCIEHKIFDPVQPQICPLLNRNQYRSHIPIKTV